MKHARKKTNFFKKNSLYFVLIGLILSILIGTGIVIFLFANSEDQNKTTTSMTDSGIVTISVVPLEIETYN